MIPEANFIQSNMENFISQDNFIREFPEKKKKKSPNGFIKYRTVEWQRFKKEYPNVTTQQFSCIAAEQWRKMSDSEKNYYIKLDLDELPKNDSDEVEQKHDKKNNKKDEDIENIERELPVEHSPYHLQLDFNNYNENLHFTNQEDEFFYPSYPLYYDTSYDTSFLYDFIF